MIWDLVLRLGGQLRVFAGFGGGGVLGWDMAAALQLGQAMGIDPWLLAEFLPPIEAVAIREMNSSLGDERG